MTSSKISINNAVNRIMESPAPILFPDTCALVDLIRVPCRIDTPRKAAKILEVANYLVSLSHTVPPKLWIVILPPIYDEWYEHSQKTISDMRQHWSKLDTTVSIAQAVASAVNISLPSATMYSDQNIENALLNLSEDFISDAILLDEDSECIHRAYARVVSKKAPAQKGGGMKDCTIIEHCIELCTQLRNAGFAGQSIFNTSNTKDFCKEGSKTELHETLKNQLDPINLLLTTNWEWTGAKLTI